MTSAPTPFIAIGDNVARAFGMDARTRMRRIATNAGFHWIEGDASVDGGLVASLDYVWDPVWLKELEGRPGSVLTVDGQPVIASVPAEHSQRQAIEALAAGALPDGYSPVAAETAQITNAELRKREQPYAMRLDPADIEPAERAAYDASYKGVTDALTLYLWRKPAFFLTRWAARTGISPNAVTAVGALLCVLAFYLFWIGNYWTGVAAGFVFMVLDTVDGKLARCTGASSTWGNIFDHGIDLIHPPFWWWAWLHGLAIYGRPLDPVQATMVIWIVIAGYVLQRVIEGQFILRHGMHIHVWQRFDSQFRLITARRNPNMVILVAALLFCRPDVGLLLMAGWTVVSLIVHAVRLAQAGEVAAQGGSVRSWLA